MSRPHPLVGVALIVLAPGIWASHLLISYALVPYSCRIGSDLPLHAVTLLAAIGGAVSTVVAVKAVRSSESGGLRQWFMVPGESTARVDDDRQTLFVLSAAMAAYFVFVVVLTGLVPVVVDRCA